MLGIYNKVVEIMGQLPPELEYLYSIGTIMLFIAILFVILSPFFIVYKLMGK